jgi:Common central domain of tyrosinase
MRRIHPDTPSFNTTTGRVVHVLLLSCATIVPTVLSRDCRTSWRRAWRDLSCEQQDEYLEAVLLLKDSGVYDEFVYMHAGVADFTHMTPEFLPWHRWFTYQFEKALQDATGKCIYVPYWDWERDAEWESESNVLHEDTFGTYGGTDGASCATDGIVDTSSSPFRWTPGMDDGPEGCLTRDFDDRFNFEGESQVLAMIANYDQYANTAQGDDLNGFRTAFEDGAHALVHGIVGGRK